jgi:poly(hydroxyalkanoate) granule-associated protein
MARKSRSSSSTQKEAKDSAQAVRDSAQSIWLAGLGAFERAKTEGPRMFEMLVEQGRQMGARARGAADDAMKAVREGNYAGAKWDKLEQVFEDRVSKSLGRLGVLTTRDVEDLSRQVRELNETVAKMMMRGAGGTAAKAPRKAAAKKKRKAKAKTKAAATPS